MLQIISFQFSLSMYMIAYSCTALCYNQLFSEKSLHTGIEDKAGNKKFRKRGEWIDVFISWKQILPNQSDSGLVSMKISLFIKRWTHLHTRARIQRWWNDSKYKVLKIKQDWLISWWKITFLFFHSPQCSTIYVIEITLKNIKSFDNKSLLLQKWV